MRTQGENDHLQATERPQKNPGDTLILDFQPPELRANTFLLFKPPQPVVPCDGSLSKLIPREILSQPPFQKRKPCLGGSSNLSTVTEEACGGKRFKPLSVTRVPHSFQCPQEHGGEKENMQILHSTHQVWAGEGVKPRLVQAVFRFHISVDSHRVLFKSVYIFN